MFNISVVIPCYNSSNTIIKALDSIFAQEFTVNEIIIIDDGSTDNTVALVTAYIKNSTFKNFKFLEQENAGPSSARNKGIKICESEWIAFLDSDDEWTSDKLKIQLQYLKLNPNISLIGGGHEKTFFNKNIYKKEINLKLLCFKNFFETPTVMVKREVCLKFLFDESMKFSEDYNLWLNITSEYKALYVNKVLSKSILKKRSYGDSGLSKNIFLMEKGELKAIKNQQTKGNISIFLYLIASCISILKFIKRFLITKIKS